MKRASSLEVKKRGTSSSGVATTPEPARGTVQYLLYCTALNGLLACAPLIN